MIVFFFVVSRSNKNSSFPSVHLINKTRSQWNFFIKRRSLFISPGFFFQLFSNLFDGLEKKVRSFQLTGKVHRILLVINWLLKEILCFCIWSMKYQSTFEKQMRFFFRAISIRFQRWHFSKFDLLIDMKMKCHFVFPWKWNLSLKKKESDRSLEE